MYRRSTPKAENRGRDPPGSDSDPPTYDESSLLPIVTPTSKPKPSKEVKPNGGKLSRRLNNFVKSNKMGETAAKFVRGPCHDFLHARTGVKGCRLAGIIRVCYASLYLYSIFLMTIQMPTLFDPRKGLLPYSITSEGVDDYAYSVFEFAPHSSLLVYAVFLLGLSSGVLLLLGIEPRWGAAGCYFFLHNLRSHNALIWDHEFHMNRTWAFFLILLPLDHITIRDGFGGLYPLVRQRLNLPPNRCQVQQQQQSLNLSTSWPMWPFRFWQVYTCMVYMGAALGKFNSETWRRGDALSWCWYDEGLGRFYPEFVIDLLYNRMLPIKLQTWLSLIIEMLCFITIWPLKTRKITFIAIVILHIGIELAMVMHIFEYLSVLGWVCFFAYPNDGKGNSADAFDIKKNDKPITTAPNTSGWRRKKTIETVFAVSMLYLLVFNTFPSQQAQKLMPAPLHYLVWKFVYPPHPVRQILKKILETTGLYSGPYILFDGKPPHFQARLTAVIRFSDGKDPVLFLEEDWAQTSYVQREIDYWYDTYEYYLLQEGVSVDAIPYYTAFSVYLAEAYGNGKIDREYDEITISPGNNVESVSIQIHNRRGSETPPSPDLGGFEPIPREWTYMSQCRYVFTPGDELLESKGQKRTLKLSTFWDYDDEEVIVVQNGCARYNKADETLHRKGQFGVSSGGDDDEGEDGGNEGSDKEGDPDEEPDVSGDDKGEREYQGENGVDDKLQEDQDAGHQEGEGENEEGGGDDKAEQEGWS
eukprot:jgi/Psemu1/254969/estExt_Genewise1Plus.C_1210137